MGNPAEERNERPWSRLELPGDVAWMVAAVLALSVGGGTAFHYLFLA